MFPFCFCSSFLRFYFHFSETAMRDVAIRGEFQPQTFSRNRSRLIGPTVAPHVRLCRSVSNF